MTWICASGALQMGLFQQSCRAGLGIDATTSHSLVSDKSRLSCQEKQWM